ncbi:MAG: cytochrome C [Planctomycetota bacterium]|nr:MAG: cytochrome C [Planctomycetota bacterium]
MIQVHDLIAVVGFAAALLVEQPVCCGAPPPPKASEASDADFSTRLPRIPPVEPAAAKKTFALNDGFCMTLVAAEPVVIDPVAMEFDAAGRLYVVEMRDYSEQAEEKLGRVRLLTDSDGDGKFEASTVFAEGLSWPTAVTCYDGGVFVAAAPGILYLKDTDGNGVADVRREIIAGFGRSNVQGLVNSLRWSLDNRIHGATSSAGGELRVVAEKTLDGRDVAEQKPLNARGRDFSFDPRSFGLRLESGGAQHGMSFDDWGRKFVCSNSNHIQLVMYEDRYAARNPLLAAPPPLVDIAAEGPAAEVFRRSPVEPWRIVRTELRVSGKAPGPIEGGGRAAGYFTSATGVTIYRGDGWPEEHRGLAIVGDVGSNLIHRKRLESAGVGLVARRMDEKSEFVASSDIWFRPVQFANGPDGCLYVADMYREVIEHPASLPPAIKKHLDLTSGRDRGRIWRIEPPGYEYEKPPRLDRMTSEELGEQFESENGWRRDTVARLLYERQDGEEAAITAWVSSFSSRPVVRLHGLYLYLGADVLGERDMVAGTRDEDPRVREHAARLLGMRANRIAGGDAIEALCNLVNDPDPRVRYQAAFSLGDFPAAKETTAALAKFALRDGNDRWMRFAVLSSSAGRAAGLLLAIVDSDDRKAVANIGEFLSEAAMLAGREANAEQLAALVDRIERLPASNAAARKLTVALAQGLSRANSPAAAKLRAEDGNLARLVRGQIATALDDAVDADAKLDVRLAAVETLSLASFDQAQRVVGELLAPQTPGELQRAAIALLARTKEASAAHTIIDAWEGLSPTARAEAVEALLARDERIPLFLAAVKDGRLADVYLDPARTNALAEHRDAKIRELAREAFVGRGAATREEREKVIAAYREALAKSGDAERGKTAFRKTCTACHRLDDYGHAVGPDLAAIGNRGAEAILLAVLDPNREVNPQYINYTLRTVDGRTVTGTIAAETATSVSLRRAEGAGETILREEIDALRSSGVSLMPEGLEKQIPPQELADVISYLLGRAAK